MQNFGPLSAELLVTLVESIVDAKESEIVSDSFRVEALYNLQQFVISYNQNMLADMEANLDKLGEIDLT